jgi:TonB dependent receptor
VTSNNTEDYTTAFAYNRASLFGQARLQWTPDLEVSAGLRYERLTSDDRAVLDPTFAGAVGIPNTTSTDGLDIVMPRAGFRYTPTNRTTITGGFGLFAGGDPGVWTLNTVAPLVATSQLTNLTSANPNTVPAASIAAVAAGTPVSIDALDPGFEIPSDWKASLRLDQEFDLQFGGLDLGDDYAFSAQVLNTSSKDTFLWREYAQTNSVIPRIVGQAPDGRPIYADLQALGLPNRTVLTNASGDDSWVYTLSLGKTFDNGLDTFASYAYQDVDFLTEGSSSRGISAWRGQVDSDRNFPSPRTSVYEVEHAFKLGVGYERDFIKDLATRVDLFGQFSSGGTFTYTFDVDNNNALFGRAGLGENPFDNSPLFVPNLNGDPRVVYAAGFDRAAFNTFVARSGMEQGTIDEVNSHKSNWNQRWDLRLQQDLPGIFGAKTIVGDNNFKLVFDIENIANLLNDEWGTQFNTPGNGQVPIVRADLISAAATNPLTAPALTGDAARTTCVTAGSCLYRFNSFTTQPSSLRSSSLSTWRLRVGLRYEF